MSIKRMAALVPALVSLACDPAPPAGAPADAGDLPRAEPGVLHAMGAYLAEEVKAYHLDEDEARELARGLSDAALGKTTAAVNSEEMQAKVYAFHEARLKEFARREELAGAFLLEQAEREPGVVKTRDGAMLKVIEPGSGPRPKLYDFVNVNFEGKLRDGMVFHTNEGKPPEKSKLGVNTRCWQEALRTVGAGARVQIVCPPALGFGWGGWPGTVPGGAVLSYEFELVSIEAQPPPPNWKDDWDEAE